MNALYGSLFLALDCIYPILGVVTAIGDHYMGERGGDVDMARDSDRSNLRAGLHPLPLAPASDSLLESRRSDSSGERSPL